MFLLVYTSFSSFSFGLMIEVLELLSELILHWIRYESRRFDGGLIVCREQREFDSSLAPPE
jgi:hypothetical protein